MENEIRACTKCGGPGPFPKRGNQCKECLNTYHRVWRQLNPEKIRSSSQKNYKKRKENGKIAQWREQHNAQPEVQAQNKERVKRNNRLTTEKRQKNEATRLAYNAYMRGLRNKDEATRLAYNAYMRERRKKAKKHEEK